MVDDAILRIDQFTVQERVIRLVLDSLHSQHSRRAYERALKDFLDWHAEQGRPALIKALIQSYLVELKSTGNSPSSINPRLTAIRKLVTGHFCITRQKGIFQE